jgi:hypothetical protein
LVIILLAAITFELGLIIIKLPTPTAQAQVSAATYPTQIPNLEDPHETLKRQVAAVQQQLTRVTQNEDKLLYRAGDDSKRLLMTCVQLTRAYKAVHGGTPGHPGLSGGFADLEPCIARGWTASYWNNFDIPFGP